MNSLRVAIALATLLCLHTEAFAECAGRGAIGYLCGVHRAEDLVAIPGTSWIVASGLRHETEPGALVLIDRAKKASTVLFPNDSIKNKHDARAFPGCPGSLPNESFSAHGLNVRRGAAGVHALYVINHGKREAVEAFELDVSKTAPVLAWKGCVLLPDGTVGNGVAPLAGGGIAVTLMAVPQYFAEPGAAARQEAWIEKFKAVQLTGHAARWTADEGWKMVPGTEGSGPNGLEASTDGQWLWVANWANKEVVRVALREGASRSVLKLDFMPDNLRWGDDGQLWVMGATGMPASYFACWAKPGCKNDYAIVKIDPTSRTSTRVPHPNTLPEFGEATTALKVGPEVWIGSNVGDRVAYMRLSN